MRCGTGKGNSGNSDSLQADLEDGPMGQVLMPSILFPPIRLLLLCVLHDHLIVPLLGLPSC